MAETLSQQRETFAANLQQRTDALVALQNQISQQQQRISELEADGSKAAEENKELQAAKDGLSKSLSDARTDAGALQNELDSWNRHHANESLKVADLQRRVEQLSATLRDQKEQIDQQD